MDLECWDKYFIAQIVNQAHSEVFRFKLDDLLLFCMAASTTPFTAMLCEE